MNILTFIELIIMFAIGYIMGLNSRRTIKEHIEIMQEGVKHLLPDKTLKPGAIRRPSAQDLLARNEPIHIREGKEAMQDLFNNDPEYQEQKRLANLWKLKKI